MSGRRCKQLREQFRRTHGRPPSLVSIHINASAGALYGKGPRVGRFVYEWRRIKKAHLQQRRHS